MTDEDDAAFRRLERAVRKLTRMQREVLLMVRLDDLTYAEIAERLGIAPAKVERHFADAIYWLDRHLHSPEKPWWRFW